MFGENETAFSQSQPLARLSTVSIGQQPDVVPVGFEFDGRYFHVGGRDIETTRKYRNVQAGDLAETQHHRLYRDGRPNQRVHERALSRQLRFSLFTEDLFETDNDDDNRAEVKARYQADLCIVGMAIWAENKNIDNLLKGIDLHP